MSDRTNSYIVSKVNVPSISFTPTRCALFITLIAISGCTIIEEDLSDPSGEASSEESFQNLAASNETDVDSELVGTSVINVGLTIFALPDLVKGSGSYSNFGAYTKVCIGLQRRTAFGVYPDDTVTEACRATSNPSSAEFSAPDFHYDAFTDGCRGFRTRVRAYRGSAVVHPQKYSNEYIPAGCP